MKLFSKDESVKWLNTHGIALDGRDNPARSSSTLEVKRLALPKEASRLLWLSRRIESFLCPWTEALFLVSAWGVWRSSENWHLYYKVRQSYGDHQLISDAPGHLFLNYEAYDLVTFIQLGLLAGWDFGVCTADDYARAFVSHDEWAEFATKDGVELAKLETDFTS